MITDTRAELDDAPLSPPARPSVVRAALAGLLAAVVALAVGELVVGLVRTATSPVVAVGEWIIDHAPPALKTYAIRRFGTNDKPVLVAGTTVVLLVLAVVLGLVARRRARLATAGIAGLGLIGAAASLTRPHGSVLVTLPSLLGGVAGAATLVWLKAAGRPQPPTPADAPGGYDRRRFLVSGLIAVGGSAGLAAAGRTLRHRFDVAADRAHVVLPKPASPAPTRPDGTDLGVDGVEPFMTPNDAFYRVDTALVAPQVRPDSWRLRIHGMVDHPFTLSYDELLRRPMVERDITLVCVSNEVGGHYAGTARWLGVPLSSLLAEAGVRSGADQLVSRSTDGFTAGTPVSALFDGRDALVAVGMNGEPLPVAHGFPARLVVPGLYGYVSATKWLTDLELTTFDRYDAYWVKRGWAQQAPIKTLTRIDTPRGLAGLAAGRVAIGGVAWAVHRGIGAVEVRIDDGPWSPARLGTVPGRDTWRQWTFPWDAAAGRHTITARAVDGTGALQTDRRAEPMPDGASGWHSIVVLVH
jgi:DMSO/TMAO reductase YedYZ molybdopterin-dependent catalytic subunit